MNQELLLALLRDIVVPEIASYIHDKMNKTGELPTQEELQKLIDDKAASIIMRGERFLSQFTNGNG